MPRPRSSVHRLETWSISWSRQESARTVERIIAHLMYFRETHFRVTSTFSENRIEVRLQDLPKNTPTRCNSCNGECDLRDNHGEQGGTVYRLSYIATFGLFFQMTISSCSSDEEEVSNVTQNVEPNWIHPACQASALEAPASDPQACNGPWTYSYQEYWINHVCGDTTTCKSFPACSSWDRTTPGDGLAFTVTSSSQTTHGFLVCDWSTGCSGADSSDQCPANADALKASLLAARPGISQSARGRIFRDMGSDKLARVHQRLWSIRSRMQ